VAELQMVADTLSLAVPQVPPPPELKERIMSVVRGEAAVMDAAGPAADVPATPATAGAEAPGPSAPAPPARPHKRRPSWWRLPTLALRPLPAAVAASVLIGAGIAGGILVSGTGESGRTVPAQVVAPSAPRARASLTVGDDRATLRVRDFPPPPRGRVYQVWLKRPGRPPDPTTALFSVRNGTATVDVPGSVKGVDQVLVTAEPEGGSRQPTRAPVIIAQPA
jgi:hypothetical protein